MTLAAAHQVGLGPRFLHFPPLRTLAPGNNWRLHYEWGKQGIQILRGKAIN